jgi:UDP-N-acetylmuramoyl-tripeptide--D-alanyl-D-alanine ligase
MAAGIAKERTYGTAETADVVGTMAENTDEEMLHFEVSSAGKTAPVATQLVGSYNLPNALVAVAVGTYFGVSLSDCAAAIRDYAPQNSRSQLLLLGTNRVVLDAYNANPTSMRAAIEAFAKGHAGTGRLWLGAMREMGEDSLKEHRELVQFIAQWPWKEVVLVGSEYAGQEEAYTRFDTVSEAVSALQSADDLAGESILLKGSRGSKMEEMLAVLPKG